MTGVELNLTGQTRDEAIAHYLSRVDAKAEKARAASITSSPGQTLTYEAKRAEANRYPNDGPFPWLEGEAEELGMTVQEVADSVKQAQAAWEQRGIEIERKRLKAKKLIREAQTTSEMQSVVLGLTF